MVAITSMYNDISNIMSIVFDRARRTTAVPHRLEDEQTTDYIHAQELLDIRRALRLSMNPIGYYSDADEEVGDESEEDDESDVDNDDDEEADDNEHKGSDEQKRRDIREKEEKEGWTTEYTPVRPRPFDPSPPSANIPNVISCPLDYFYQFLPASFLSDIVIQINDYAEQQLDADKENRVPTLISNDYITTKGKDGQQSVIKNC